MDSEYVSAASREPLRAFDLEGGGAALPPATGGPGVGTAIAHDRASTHRPNPCFKLLKTLFDSLWGAVSGLCRKTDVFALPSHSVTVDKQIGEGGFSFVYLVQGDDGRSYALKKILVQTPEQRHAAEWEIRVMRELKSPHVLPLLDTHTVPHESRDDVQYVLMLFPFIRQGTLAEHVRLLRSRGEFLMEEDLLEMFRDICKGVLVLHNHQPSWAHRDLKLDNVLLDVGLKPLLMDFGSVSEAVVHVDSRGEAVQLQDWAAQHSTGSYRAPELFDCPSHCTIDSRTDVWSLGCLLYGMAFGGSPFDLSEGASWALAVCSGKYTVPDDSPFSDELHDMIAWMLQTDHTKRPFVPEVVSRVEASLKHRKVPQKPKRSGHME